MITGFAAGYYMGSKAGRQRYDQINQAVSKLRRSETFENATETAKAVVDDGVEKARSMVDSKIGDDQNGHGVGSPNQAGLIIPGQSEPKL